MQLSFSGRRFSCWFLLADVRFPILGVDFLRAHKLVVNPATGCLVDTTGRRLDTTALPSGPTASVVLPTVLPPCLTLLWWLVRTDPETFWARLS